MTTICQTRIPGEWTKYRQFVGWRFGDFQNNGKRKKEPINPSTGRLARTTNPKTWGTYEEALEGVERWGLEGIGFVFSEDDPYVFVDLDGCVNSETGEIEPWASRLVERFDSYTEVSPSGTGLHIYVRGTLPGGNRRRGPVEMYHERHYGTLTGDLVGPQEAVEARQEAIEGLYTRLTHKGPQEAVSGRREAVKVPVEDAELLEKARNAKNGPKFRKLYDEGDVSGHDFDESRADIDLAGMLAFWTGRDSERMERMFGASALGRRGKWTSRPDYRRDTIEKAINGCARVYEGKAGRAEPRKQDDDVVQMLEALYRDALGDPWTGRTGPGERWAFHALMNTGGVYGKACEDGVIVSAATRDIAPECGSQRQTVEKSLKKLEERGRIRCLKRGRGKKASLYLLPRVGHKENKRVQSLQANNYLPRVGHKESLTKTHCVHLYGPGSAATLSNLLAKVRNAPPQTDKGHDKNGRKIAQESKYLLRPIGDLNALLIEKVAAWPGQNLAGISKFMRRPPSKVERNLNLVVEGGFIVEMNGGYYVPNDIIERLEVYLEASGCNAREKALREKYDAQRAEYEKEHDKKHRERLEQVARECGVEALEPVKEAPEPVEPVVENVGEVRALAREVFGALAPTPPEPFTWPCDPAKAELYRKGREEWAEKCRKHMGRGLVAV